MKHILLVDDDPLVLRIYQQVLSYQGFKVDTASDGLEAIKALRASLPDLMVLDLMMPKLSGPEVLKRMRSDSQLANVPVVVLSNAYMDPAAGDAAALGAKKGLLKATCSPWLLVAVIEEVLGGRPAGEDESHLLAAPPASLPPQPARLAHNPQDEPPANRAVPVGNRSAENAPASDYGVQSLQPGTARRDFIENGHATCLVLGELFGAFIAAPNELEGQLRLKDLYRKVHFVEAMAAVVECHQIAHMAAALEAVLFGLMNKQSLLSPSLRRTTGQVVAFFEELFQHAREWPPLPPHTALALVVDDDPLSNRLAVAALRTAQVQAHSTNRPTDALRLFEQNRYDLVLLDIEMEGMKGFEVSRRLRSIPGYLRTPVIFVTAHKDFDVRAKAIETGGDDVIAKPILPVELAAKAVMHLLKTQMLTIPTPVTVPQQALPQELARTQQGALPGPARPQQPAQESRIGSRPLLRDTAKAQRKGQ